MKLKKVLVISLAVFILAAQGLAACTIFAVGKDATVDGSTMTSHTCDSNSDDLRLWLIPSMDAGVSRDVVLDGRAGADYSQFPEVKDYGSRGMVMGSYTPTKATNQYLHGMYSFANDKGLAMGESTCSYDRNTEQGLKLRDAFGATEGIYDCYMLQDLALENCSTAREAVEFMGKMVEEYGWNGAAECINICDGNEAWVMEIYGGTVWVAARVPDNAVFVAANRCRIIDFIEDDPENYLYAPHIKDFALEYGLWDGVSAFQPCNIFAPSTSLLCTLREWRAIMLLDPSLNLVPPTPEYGGNPDDYPVFVVPKEKVSVKTIHDICSDYYQGTEFDTSRTLWAGPFGNPINTNYVYRPINMIRTTYIQIAQIKSWLPEEARCLVWFGWGAPLTNYMTPVFASQTELAPHFGRGVRSEFDANSGWWNLSHVQQLSSIVWKSSKGSSIEDIRAVRDSKQDKLYKQVAAVQDMAASMINLGMKEEAVDYLTTYANTVATDWFETYKELGDMLEAKYMLGNVNMSIPAADQWFMDVLNENLGDKLRPIE